MQVVVEREDDALAHAPQCRHALPLEAFWWWLDRPDDEGIPDPNPLQRLPDNSRRQCLQIDDDVGELGHCRSVLPDCPHRLNAEDAEDAECGHTNRPSERASPAGGRRPTAILRCAEQAGPLCVLCVLCG